MVSFVAEAGSAEQTPVPHIDNTFEPSFTPLWG